MKKTIITGISFLYILFFAACGSDSKKDSSEEAQNIETTYENRSAGFATIEDLSGSVIESIKNKNFESYLTHIMSREEELAQSKRIENDSIRQDFVSEFSFSLHAEEEYFNEMIKYLNDSEINLDRVLIDESIVIDDYKEKKYAPCEMAEVIVPIEHLASEIDLVYVAIKINGKWYLTAELSI